MQADALQILDPRSPADFVTARDLFSEYAAGLAIDLSFQHFSDELDRIDEIYAPPRGAVLLAWRDQFAAGCVALRPFRDQVCEMKRLFVRTEARGHRVGQALAAAIIERARQLGYERMVLDTLESMTAARTLYESLGFRRIPPYYANPLPDAAYFGLDL
jgi:ribosomal protein S18 acetylase RimI-like enzyme